MSGCTTAGAAFGATHVASLIFERPTLRSALPDSGLSAVAQLYIRLRVILF